MLPQAFCYRFYTLFRICGETFLWSTTFLFDCTPLSCQITFKNEMGQYDLEVTTFQLAVLFAWNQRPRERISFENLKLATELPDAELRRTLWVRGFRDPTSWFLYSRVQ